MIWGHIRNNCVAILTAPGLLKEQVALLEFHDPLVVVDQGGDFFGELEGKGLETCGLSTVHHHSVGGLIKGGLGGQVDLRRPYIVKSRFFYHCILNKFYCLFFYYAQLYLHNISSKTIWGRKDIVCIFNKKQILLQTLWTILKFRINMQVYLLMCTR